MDFGRFELSKWLFTTLLGNYQSRLSPTDSAEEAINNVAKDLCGCKKNSYRNGGGIQGTEFSGIHGDHRLVRS